MAKVRAWWPGSHAEVLRAAPVLQDCDTPTELEEAVCELLGRHWLRMYEKHTTGFHVQEWLKGLLTAAAACAGEPAVRRLLYGIAVIAPPELAGTAQNLLSRDVSAGEEPAWLGVPPTVTASPDVQLLRDVYGLRCGLLTQVTGPSGQPRTYLLDVDLCHGFHQVPASGYYPDVATAAAAWRALVGVSAVEAEPVVAPADLLQHVLPGVGMIDGLFGAPQTDDHFREIYRGDRIVSAIVDALDDAGRPITRPHRDLRQDGGLARSLVERFRNWAAANGVDLPTDDDPDDDIVAWMVYDWVLPGMPEQLCLACSPHRIAAFTAYLNDDWMPEVRDRALTVLEPWARYCLESSGVTGTAAEHTLAWAARAAREPEAVGADLGDSLSCPFDETTVTESALPGHD